MDLPDKKAKKKKKKKKRKHKSKDKASAAVGAIPADGEDWTYDQLLTRVFETIHAANPDHDNASTTVELEAPALVRVGTKKTGIVNFKEICEAMNRPLEHVLSFVLAELGTTGTFAADHRLTLKGRFQNRHIENVLRHYVSNYLICQNCHSPNTVLTKGASCTVVFWRVVSLEGAGGLGVEPTVCLNKFEIARPGFPFVLPPPPPRLLFHFAPIFLP